MKNLSITEKFDLIMSYFKDNKATFARKGGMTKQTLNNYYSNGSKPSYMAIKKIAEAYNINLDWILSDSVTDATGMLKEAQTEQAASLDLLQKMSKQMEFLTQKVTDLETLIKKQS